MNKLFGLLLLIIFSANTSKAQGHKINFEIKNLNDSIVYLARYYGDNKYIKDTIIVNGSEKFTIKGKEDLECGIYLIVREKRNSYFEFLVSNQKFSVYTDTTDFVNKTRFKNSPDNDLMYKSIKYEIEKRELVMDTNISVEKKQLIYQELKTYKDKFIKENPNNPMSVIFQIQKDVDMPKELKDIQGQKGDEARYYYYLKHYWDNVNFSSPCLLRTPVFHGKLQRYFDKYIPQHYDSIPKYADLVCRLAKANDENFKYVVNYLTFKWESGKSKRMCWDRVFYHMAREYYLSIPTQTPWVDDAQMAKIKSKVEDLTYALCSDKAVPLQMKYKNYNFPSGLTDTLGMYHDFYKMDEDYIILWFWDSDCGHCKTQTPKLYDFYKKLKKEKRSVQVYAINIEQESKPYLKYLRENKYDWINVQDTGHFSNFRAYYDIFSTPVAYILDKERRIIGKRIDPEGMEAFFKQIFENEEKKKKIKKEEN